jgi:hypothetical protein
MQRNIHGEPMVITEMKFTKSNSNIDPRNALILRKQKAFTVNV